MPSVVYASQENQERVVNAPMQKNLSGHTGTTFHNGRLQYLAEYDVTARILGKKYYYSGKESEVSPLDLVLGWGRMSNPSIYSQFRITQQNRFYRWWTSAYPIPRREIEMSSVNMHVIPANDEVLNALDKLKKGDLVRLKGYLVHYKEGDSRKWWAWKSSLVRTDVGDGACELMYVEQVLL